MELFINSISLNYDCYIVLKKLSKEDNLIVMAKIGIIIGSDSDLDKIEEACKTLDDFGIDYELRVASAHRTPNRVKKYVESAERRGIEAPTPRAPS